MNKQTIQDALLDTPYYQMLNRIGKFFTEIHWFTKDGVESCIGTSDSRTFFLITIERKRGEGDLYKASVSEYSISQLLHILTSYLNQE